MYKKLLNPHYLRYKAKIIGAFMAGLSIDLGSKGFWFGLGLSLSYVPDLANAFFK